MANYKLTYFNIMGRAEPCRLLFAYAGVPYEDHRISHDEWPKLKETLPFPGLPILDVDGKRLQQSLAIYRFLGKRFDAVPKDEFETARCDMLADGMQDVLSGFRTWVFERDPEVKKQKWIDLRDNALKPFCQRYERFITESGTGYFVGKSLTWCDLLIYSRLFVWLRWDPEIFAGCPNLKKFVADVGNIPSIKKWVESRPQTDS